MASLSRYAIGLGLLIAGFLWWKPWSLPAEYHVGRVVQVGETICEEMGGTEGAWQVCHRFLTVQQGKESREIREDDAGSVSGQAWLLPLRVGAPVLLMSDETTNAWQVVDLWRLTRLASLVLLFLLIAFLVGGRRVGGALLSMAVTAWVAFTWLIPGVLAGWVWWQVTLFLTAVAGVSILMAHGWNRMAHIAGASTMLTVLVAGCSGWLMQQALLLTGMGSEEAVTLVNNLSLSVAPLLLFTGMMLGCLGVLDDVAVAQAALVDELHLAYTNKSKREWFAAAMRVGREHVLSLVNTLVLAYAGTAFVLLVYVQTNVVSWGLLLNSETVMEELSRMLVGSMAVLLAVPLTTALAVWWPWRTVRASSTHHHHHSHSV